MRRFLLPAFLLALAAAPPAHAGTVTARFEQRSDRTAPYTLLKVTYVAAPGEVNDVKATGTFQSVELRDAGAPIALEGSGCTRVDDRAVRCAHADLEATIDLGDGDDRLTGTGVPFTQMGPGADVATITRAGSLDGGPGDDDLTGPSIVGGEGDDRLTTVAQCRRCIGRAYGAGGRDVLFGMAGPDELDGGPGADELHGGGGADRLNGADDEAVRDVLDGGDGVDTAAYLGRKRRVRVDLAGDSGEDRIVAVEGAVGGAGDDVLLGGPGDDAQLVGGAGDDRIDGGDGRDALRGEAGEDRLDGGGAADTLVGGPGDDRLDGGAGGDVLGDAADEGGDDALDGGTGDDRLHGSEGADRLDGGAGDDTIVALDHMRDRISCGRGRGDELSASAGDVRRDRCETTRLRAPSRVVLGTVPGRATPVGLAVRAGRVQLAIACFQSLAEHCRGTAELHVGGRRVSRARFRCSPIMAGCLNGVGRLRLPAGTALPARAVVVVRFAGGGLALREPVRLRRQAG